MRTKNQISLTRKTLYGIMLLGIFLSAFGAGNLPPARAQETMTDSPTATAMPVNNGWKIFSDPGLGISIQYPDTWSVTDGHAHAPTIPGDGITFQSEPGNFDVTVVVFENSEDLGIDTLAQFLVTIAYGEVENYYSNPRVNSSVSARTIEFTQPLPEQGTLNLLSTVFLNNGVGYWFVTGYEEPGSLARAEIYNQMLNTVILSTPKRSLISLPNVSDIEAIKNEQVPISSMSTFTWPTTGYVGWIFGRDGHNGIDIWTNTSGTGNNGSKGNPIYPPYPGQVTSIYVDQRLATQGIRVEHAALGLWTFYWHMADESTGQSYIEPDLLWKSVNIDSLLGYQGNRRWWTTGDVITHLHLTVSSSDAESNAIDPSSYFDTRLNWADPQHIGWMFYVQHSGGGSGSVGGRVFNTSGQPVSGVNVHATAGGTSAITDTNGSYILDFVPAGNTTIKASHPSSGQGTTTLNVQPNMSQQAEDITLIAACVPANGLSQAVGLDSCPPDSTIDNATFISDVTLPDGTVVSPGQALTKTWRVKNVGTSTWGSGYQLVLLDGDPLGAPGAVNILSTPPGQEVDVSVPLQVPSNTSPGTYTAHWRLRNPQGTYFGDVLLFSLVISQSGGTYNGVELINVSYPSSVSPGQQFRPEITVKVTSGQLLESRGDMLRFYSGTNYSDFPHVAVQGTVNSGQTFTFQFYSEHPMVAPGSDGTYESRWRVWANGGWVGPEIIIQFTVYSAASNRPPNKPSLTSPQDWAVLVGQMPTLCAQQTGDPDGDSVTQYRFVIFESAQNWDSGWVSTNCVTPSGLGNYGYQWHAQVRDSRGAVSDWSDVRHFNIESSTLTITDFHFIPGSPSNTNPIIIWVETSGCGGVNVGGDAFVNTANDGTGNGVWNKIKDIAGPKTNMEDAPRWDILEYTEGDHLVRVDMKSCDNSHTIQDQHYTLTRGAPSRPYLLNPSNGFWSNSRTITFIW